ncbi:MAG: GntR family transcriptional regulator [Candidatus Hydrogenedentes bacterium]|nr:GntR family transcriptional regulator [Candidatus Hydrogenedentota bacterium]
MSNDARYSVNFDSPLAVYTQIENQILFDVASGRLKAGDRAPSGRDLALMLGVNPNTVMKAYRDLELCGIVESRRGVGVTITEKAPKLARDRAGALVTEHLREAVAECVAVGIKPAQIRSLAADTITKSQGPYRKR